MIRRLAKRLPHAVRGLLYALRNDSGFRHQFYFASFFAVVILYFFNPLTVFEFFFLSTAAMFVIITELQNSAFEHALDRSHPEKHDSIKHSKDMAAASVLLAALYALMILSILCAIRILG